MKPRKAVTIDGNMLRAIFTRPTPSDTRGFSTRLITSLQPVVRFGKRGLTYIGVRGKVEF
jgi:hypothetical protein